MENSSIKNIKYSLINSSLADHHEVVVTFDFNKQTYHRFLFIKKNKGVEPLQEAKKIIESEIKRGVLIKNTKRGIGPRKNAALITLTTVSFAAACALGGLLTYKYISNGNGGGDEPSGDVISVKTNLNNCDCKVPENIKKGDKFTQEYQAIAVTDYVVAPGYFTFAYENITATTDDYKVWPVSENKLCFAFIPKDNVVITINAVLYEEPNFVPTEDSKAKADFVTEVDPIFGKTFIIKMALKEEGDLLVDKVIVKSGVGVLTKDKQYTLVENALSNGKNYLLSINPDYVIGKIEVSNLIIKQEGKIIIYTDDSSIPLTISPSSVEIAAPYEGTLTLNDKGEDLELSTFTVTSDSGKKIDSLTIEKVLPLTGINNSYTLKIGGIDTKEDLIIHADALVGNYQVDSDTFDKATSLEDIDNMHCYHNRKLSSETLARGEIEDYAPNFYHQAWRNALELDEYSYVEGDKLYHNERESVLGAWVNVDITDPSDPVGYIKLPSDSEIAEMMERLNGARIYQMGLPSIYEILEKPTDSNPYYTCDDWFKDAPEEGEMYKGVYTNIKFRFYQGKVTYLSYVADRTQWDADGIEYHEYNFAYGNEIPHNDFDTITTEINSADEWKSALTLSEDEKNKISILYNDQAGAYNQKRYTYNGADLYSIFSESDSSTEYYEHNEDGNYYVYRKNDDDEYERLPIERSVYELNLVDVIWNKCASSLTGRFGDFTASKQEDDTIIYTLTEDGTDTTLKFMNGKLASIKKSGNQTLVFEVARYGYNTVVNLPCLA